MKINLLAMVFVIAGFAGPVLASEQVPFKGSMAAVELQVVQGGSLLVDGSGAGNATQLGRFTMSYHVEVDLATGASVGTGDFRRSQRRYYFHEHRRSRSADSRSDHCDGRRGRNDHGRYRPVRWRDREPSRCKARQPGHRRHLRLICRDDIEITRGVRRRGRELRTLQAEPSPAAQALLRCKFAGLRTLNSGLRSPT